MPITKENVECYLADVKDAVRANRYVVSARPVNEELFDDYVFDEERQKEILLDLCVDDFCEAVPNEHSDYSHEILYVFGKDVRLLPRFGGGEVNVSLYIKFNKLENNYTVVISFHEQKYPLKYKFK